jgi:hypothetical protein
MPSLSQITPFIIAALLAMAALIPGLNAAEQAILDLKSARKLNAKEACLVETEKQSRGKFNEIQFTSAKSSCENKLNNEIDKNYNPALLYVCKFRQLVTFSSVSGATSASVEAAAATSEAVAACEEYE